jgi:peptide/nickel transport system permease protein
VTEIIFERLPNTLQLTGASFLIAIGIGVPIGIFTATRAGRTVRYGVNFVTMAAVSMPTFWVGLMVILVFAGELRLIPSGGMQTIGEPFSITDRLRHLIAPAIVLATARLASFSRYTHSTMVEVMLEDFIRVARAKGLPERVVVFRHGFRNVMITIVTLMGLLLPALFSGALITEAVFSWPGNGRLLVDSLVRRDYPLVMGNLMVIALLVVMGNFLADLAYGILDPRIRYE